MPVSGVTSVRRTAVALTSAPPTLKSGAKGPAVTELQKKLAAAGFSAGSADGEFGPKTQAAVKAFQQANGLEADGVVGPKTWAKLGAGGSSGTTGTGGDTGGKTYRYAARGTAYFPSNDPIEGGFKDRVGKPLYTLQQYLAGNAPYVSVAMDSRAFPYGTKLRIPELEKKYGRQIEFRVVDTGGAFVGKGTSRIDICVANRAASMDATINGPLTLDADRPATR